MSELDSDRSSLLNADPANADPAVEALLDISSLNTVLAMLEVIDSVEELALLETLTLAQKRQVWDATSASTRNRLKQLRATAEPSNLQHGDKNGTAAAAASESNASSNASNATHHDSFHDSFSAPAALLDSFDQLDDRMQNDWLSQTEDSTLLDLESLEEIDLSLHEAVHEPLNLTAQPTVVVGDWIVLHAKPKLSRAELMAIWEVLEVRGNYARISAQALGTRLYPTAWMVVYPKPIEQEPEF
jgi:hypothetical protein